MEYLCEINGLYCFEVGGSAYFLTKGFILLDCQGNVIPKCVDYDNLTDQLWEIII